MMTTDKASLAFQMAKQGWSVFPVNTHKTPFKDFKWKEESTNDPEIIGGWLEEYPSCNFAVDCGKSGLLVVDIDIKGDDNGLQTLELLEEEYGELPETFIVDTPSGGRHIYFTGKAPTTGPKSKNKLGPGIDTRGAGGYVVAAGSADDRGEYLIMVKKATVPIPQWISERLGMVVDKSDGKSLVSLVEIDLQANIISATQYLVTDAEPAIEGAGGDSQTLQVAMDMRDRGISEHMTVELMAKFYNPRCEPAWDVEELERKVSNAYQYANNAPGSLAAEISFDTVELESPVRKAQTITLRSASEFDEQNLAPRRWILGRRFIRGYVTVTVSPGGVGKSTLATAEAISIVSGKALTNTEVYEPGPVWMFNTEDPQDELERRVIATAKHHGIPLEKLRNLYVTSGRNAPLRIVSAEGEVNETAVSEIIKTAKELNLVAIIFDPFVRLHSVNENDNMMIDLVVQQLSRIADEVNCAVHVVHHTRKLGSEGGRGNAETARGASSLISAARVAHTIDQMSAIEAESFGISEEAAGWYMRIDDAKSNMAAPADRVQWFVRRSIRLANGDDVGTIEPVNLSKAPAVADQRYTQIADALWKAYSDGELETPMLQTDVVSFFEDRRRMNGELLFDADTGAMTIARHCDKALPRTFGHAVLTWESRNITGTKKKRKYLVVKHIDPDALGRLMPNDHHLTNEMFE